MLPVVLKCLTMFPTVVLDSNSLSAIATFDSPRLCSVMIFSRITKHFVIFECTKFLTQDSADIPTWVSYNSCKTKKCGKIQIVVSKTKNVRPKTYGAPCTRKKLPRLSLLKTLSALWWWISKARATRAFNHSTHLTKIDLNKKVITKAKDHSEFQY